MWTHFETIHVTMKPTYMSMYFPAQGLVLAAGKVLTGHPWYGILLMTAFMCAAICWMLQAWLPPTWALLVGCWRSCDLGLFSYWINTYSGAGSIAALGGALVLGALPRFMKTLRLRDGTVDGNGRRSPRHFPPVRGHAFMSPGALLSGLVDVLWKESAFGGNTDSPHRRPVGADRGRRSMDGVLQLPRIRKPTYTCRTQSTAPNMLWRLILSGSRSGQSQPIGTK